MVIVYKDVFFLSSLVGKISYIKVAKDFSDIFLDWHTFGKDKNLRISLYQRIGVCIY